MAATDDGCFYGKGSLYRSTVFLCGNMMNVRRITGDVPERIIVLANASASMGQWHRYVLTYNTEAEMGGYT